jgi:hypothetical protein
LPRPYSRLLLQALSRILPWRYMLIYMHGYRSVYTQLYARIYMGLYTRVCSVYFHMYIFDGSHLWYISSSLAQESTGASYILGWVLYSRAL